MSSRTFTVVKIRKPGQKSSVTSITSEGGGRYVSASPQAAAKKAFSRACSAKRIKGQCTLEVTIRETTAGSGGKQFSYKFKRVKLPEPVVMPGGFSFKYKIETA